MYIEFTKKHPVGIAKGEVRDLQEGQAIKMITEKYAKEINKEEYEELRSEMLKKIAERAETQKEESAEENKDRFSISDNNEVEEKGEEEEVEEVDDREFYKVTEDDIESNPDFKARGVKVGDELLLDQGQPKRTTENGNYIGRDGELGKSKPSSEKESGSSEKGSGSNGGDSKGGEDGSQPSTEKTPKEEEKKENPPKKEGTIYSLLTEDDMKDHPIATEGMKVGDEVEIVKVKNEKDRFVIGDDKKFILKPSKESTPEIKYHTLTKEDIDQNKLDDKVWKVGDQVQILDNDDFPMDKDGELIRKPKIETK